jgi:hypothetical protein
LRDGQLGLSGIGWVPKLHLGWPARSRHGHRIKVVNVPGRVDPADSVSFSIEDDDPRVVAGTPGPKLDAKKIRWVKEFIKLNKDIILRHARMEISDRELKADLRFPK